MTQSSKLPTLQMPRSEVEERLRDRIVFGKELLKLEIVSERDLSIAYEKEEKWSDYNGELLKRIVDTKDFVKEYYPSAVTVQIKPIPLRERIADFHTEVKNYVSKLESILERLELIPEASHSTPTQGPQTKLSSVASNRQQRKLLHKTLCDDFSEEDIRTLCFHLDVDYDDLPAIGKKNKVRELISHIKRTNRILELIEEGKEIRPRSQWEL